MDWQLIAVCVVLAVAGGYLARQFWRTWFQPAGCGSGCGKCSETPTAETAEDRRRISLL